MPIEATWLQEPTIRLNRYTGKVSASELEASLADELVILKASDHKLYYIVEFVSADSFNANPMAMPAALEMVRHPNYGAIAVIQSSIIMNFWVTVFSKISGNKVTNASDIAHARQLLEKMIGAPMLQ
jgi:hypothetical protein